MKAIINISNELAEKIKSTGLDVDAYIEKCVARCEELDRLEKSGITEKGYNDMYRILELTIINNRPITYQNPGVQTQPISQEVPEKVSKTEDKNNKSENEELLRNIINNKDKGADDETDDECNDVDDF